jgi:hypothetical protein
MERIAQELTKELFERDLVNFIASITPEFKFLSNVEDLKKLNLKEKIALANDKLMFVADDKEVSVYIPPNSCWIDARNEIEKIYDVNPQLAEKVAVEFSRKYRLGFNPLIDQMLLSDTSYALRTVDAVYGLIARRLDELGIKPHVFLPGETNKVRIVNESNAIPFLPSKPKTIKTYESLFSSVCDSWKKISSLEIEESSAKSVFASPEVDLQTAVLKESHSFLTQEKNRISVYDRLLPNDLEWYELANKYDSLPEHIRNKIENVRIGTCIEPMYKCFDLVEFGGRTVVVTDDADTALKKLDELEKAYKKSRKILRKELDEAYVESIKNGRPNYQKIPRTDFLKQLRAVRQAIVNKNFITHEQEQALHRLPEEAEELAFDVIQKQLFAYAQRVPAKKVGWLTENYEIEPEALESFYSLYKTIKDECRVNGIGEAIADNALNSLIKNLKKQGKTEDVAKLEAVKKEEERRSGTRLKKYAACGIFAVGGLTAFLLSDFDADGLPTWKELSIGSNPFNPDTSGSGLTDGELYYHGFDPTKYNGDPDKDHLSNRYEKKYGTNPFSKDTDGDGITDADEILSYPHILNPLKPDAEKLLSKLPNVEAKLWPYNDYSWLPWRKDPSDYDMITIYGGYIAPNDPLVKYYAAHTRIKWTGHGHGELFTDGERLFLKYDTEVRTPLNAAYMLSHGRRGVCVDDAIMLCSVLKAKGYPSIYVCDAMHAWTETYINGTVYVADYHRVLPREEYHRKAGIMWDDDIYQPYKLREEQAYAGEYEYDPEWYRQYT